MADRPESAATQIKLPSCFMMEAAAPGVVCVDGVGTEPDTELVAAGRETVPEELRITGEELAVSEATADEGKGVSPCGIDICPVADEQGVLV